MTNSAHMLHDLLTLVRAKNQLTLSEAWAEILGASYGSVEFARRHAQVVALLNDTAIAVSALQMTSRERMQSHIAAWWEAVVTPGGSWAAQRTFARNVISDVELENLANAADLIDAHMAGSTFAPHDLLLDNIERICADWVVLIPEAALAPEYERALVAQVEYLRWLVSNAQLFGAASISREALRMLGSLSASTKDVGNSKVVGTWKRGCAALAVTITTFTGAATLAGEALEATNSVIRDFEELVSEVSDLGESEGPDSSDGPTKSDRQ